VIKPFLLLSIGVTSAACLCVAVPPLLELRSHSQAREPIPPQDDFVYAGRRLSAWIELLDNPDPLRRLAAARALAEIGPAAKPAVPALIDKVVDDDFLRSDASFTLGEIGPAAKPAIPAMIQAARHTGYFEQGIIGSSIGKIGPTAIPALIDLARNQPKLRWVVLDAIKQIGPDAQAAVPCLTEMLLDNEISVRVEAAYAIWLTTHRLDMIGVMASAFRDSEEYAKLVAGDNLGAIGPEAVKALPTLVQALGDEYDNVRNRAATAIGRIGPKAKAVVPDLLRARGRVEKRRRPVNVTIAITQIGQDAVPALLDGLKDGSKAVRQVSVFALAAIGPPGALEAIPRLGEMLTCPDADERVMVAAALWKLRRDDRALPVFLRVVRERDASVHPGLFFDPDLHIVRDLDTSAYPSVLWQIDLLGSEAKVAVPDLIDVVEHEKKAYIRTDAAIVLGHVGPDAQAAIPALRAALNDQDERLSAQAALALWRIAADEVALSFLIEKLRSSEKVYLTHFSDALTEIGPPAAATVPIFIEKFKSHRDYRYTAMRALAKIGPAAKAALPTLIEAFNEERSLDRRQIIAAIRAIDPNDNDKSIELLPFLNIARNIRHL